MLMPVQESWCNQEANQGLAFLPVMGKSVGALQ